MTFAAFFPTEILAAGVEVGVGDEPAGYPAEQTAVLWTEVVVFVDRLEILSGAIANSWSYGTCFRILVEHKTDKSQEIAAEDHIRSTGNILKRSKEQHSKDVYAHNRRRSDLFEHPNRLRHGPSAPAS